MCHKLDQSFFANLSAMDYEDVCRRSLAGYDADRKTYKITALEREYEINAARCEIIPLSRDEKPVSVELGLLLLFYLMQGKDIPLKGKWVGENDLTGGAMFFRGPHAIRNDEVAKEFGRNIEGFRKACRDLGGEPVDFGDAAFRFKVLPRIPALVVLWRADDEFKATAKLLMDETVEQHLPLDVIFGMALELLGRIVGRTLWH